MSKRRAKHAPYGFRLLGVAMIQCDLCPSRAYSGHSVATRIEDTDASFRSRGWEVCMREDGAVIQACARCARRLGPQWTRLEPVEGARQ